MKTESEIDEMLRLERERDDRAFWQNTWYVTKLIFWIGVGAAVVKFVWKAV